MERQRLRMEGRSGDQRRTAAVNRIPKDRVMDIGKVNTDLMRPAGPQCDGKQ